jgi:hypothetical protein
MRQKYLHRSVASFVGMVTILVACTSSPNPSPSPTAAYARYYFIAARDTGVFEVTTAPPSVCYSTQSDPARPIALIEESSGRAVVSYRPSRVQYCDRQVSTELAAHLIADPSAFIIRWSPQAGLPVVETRLTAT